MNEKILKKINKDWLTVAIFVTAVCLACGVCIMIEKPDFVYALLFIVLPAVAFALFIVQKVLLHRGGADKAFVYLLLLSIARLVMISAAAAVSTARLVLDSGRVGDVDKIIAYIVISFMTVALLLSIMSMISEIKTFRQLRKGGDSISDGSIYDAQISAKNKILPIERISLAVVETFIGVALLLGALYCIMGGIILFYVPTLVVLILFTAVQSVFFRDAHFKDSRVLQTVLSCIKWLAVILPMPIFVFYTASAGWHWGCACDTLPKGSFPHIMSMSNTLVITFIILAGLAAIAAFVMELVFSARIKKRNKETEGNE